MSTSPVPIPAPWRETSLPDEDSRGFVRIELSGFEVRRVQALIVDAERVAYYDERRPLTGQIVLEARSELDLVLMMGCVDDGTAEMIRRAWLWRAELLLMLAARSEAARVRGRRLQAQGN